MTTLGESLLNILVLEASQSDLLEFHLYLVDNFVARNSGSYPWVCELCGLKADADFDQVYYALKLKERQNGHS